MVNQEAQIRHMGSQPAGDPRPTINTRIHNTNLALQEICRELERFLERVSPRPPVPTPGNLANKTIERVGPPPMEHVVENLSETVHRLHSLVGELSQIA